MDDDPVVQILREAAARGRQLRLARERVAIIEPRTDGDTAEGQIADLAIGVFVRPQHDGNAVKTENST